MSKAKPRKKPKDKKPNAGGRPTKSRKKPKKKKAKKPGRPTKYRKSFCTQIIKYFTVEPTKKTEGELIANKLVFLSNFAHHIGVSHETLHEWCKVHPEFSVAYAHAKELQKQHLIHCGLLGLFNSHFAIFTAKNIADMKDKQEVEVGGKDGKPIPVQIVDFKGIDDTE